MLIDNFMRTVKITWEINDPDLLRLFVMYLSISLSLSDSRTNWLSQLTIFLIVSLSLDQSWTIYLSSYLSLCDIFFKNYDEIVDRPNRVVCLYVSTIIKVDTQCI